MVKQTKTFKKGNVTKKALSAILAASMVMTSSSFVMAAPVEVEDVAVEAAAEVAVDAEENEAVEEVEAADEEQVGVQYKKLTVQLKDPTKRYTYTGEKIEPEVVVTATKMDDSAEELNSNDYTVTYDKNINAGKAKITVTPVAGIVVGDTTPVETTFTINQLSLNASNTRVTYEDVVFTYNGKVQTPAIKSVKVAGKELDVNLFKVVGVTKGNGANQDNLKTVKTQNIKLAVKDATGNYSVSDNVGQSTYVIAPAEFNKDNISATAKKVQYGVLKGTSDDSTIKTYLTVVNSAGEKLDNSDYQIAGLYDANGISVRSNSNVSDLEKGTYTVELKENGGNYTGTSKVSVALEIVDGTLETLVKNGLNQVKVNNSEVVTNKDVTDADAEITYEAGECKIDGLTFTGTLSGAGLYEVEAVELNGVGTYNVLVKGKGEYGGQEATVVVKVAPKTIADAALQAEDEEPPINNTADFIYTAKLGKNSSNAIVTIKRKAVASDDSAAIVGGYVLLKEGVDYTYTTNKTTGKVEITGIGNYTTEDKTDGTKTVDKDYIPVSKILLSEPTITATVSGTYTYTGSQITPDASAVTVMDNGVVVSSREYTLSYGANTNTGKGTITITAKTDSLYTGKKVVEFDIHGQDIAEKFAIKDIKEIQLATAKQNDTSGNPKGIADVSVVYKNASTATLPAANYDVTYSRDGKVIATKKGRDNVLVKDANAFKKTGKIDVEVTGKGQYEGTLKTSYNIVGTDIATQIEVEDIADQTYTGTAVEPAVKVTTKVTKYFVKDKDYTVTYKNNVEAGVAYAVITGIGDYSGEIVKSFKIVGDMDQTIEVLAAQERDLGNGSRTLNSKATKIKYTAKTAVTFESSNPDVVTVDAEGNIEYTGIGEATITIKAAAENGYKAATKEVKVVVGLAKPSFTPFSKNNAFTLTSSTVKGAEKFEVQYATKSDFSNKKSKTFTATSGKVRQVKVSAADKKTYYVRVRAISGTTKSAWSTTKTVATK